MDTVLSKWWQSFDPGTLRGQRRRTGHKEHRTQRTVKLLIAGDSTTGNPGAIGATNS